MNADEGRFRILNWNVAGAKYLDLKSQEKHPEMPGYKTREGFKEQLNRALREKIREQDPHVITLQEVVSYNDSGDDSSATNILDVPEDYYYFFEPLIDTKHYSAPRKWNNVKERGEWRSKAFFAQGNAIMIIMNFPSFAFF